MNRTHRIYLDTWLINSSIVGLYAILKNANKEDLINFDTDKNYIEIDESFLQHFEEDYFNYFIDTHSDNLLYTKIIEKIRKILETDNDTIINELKYFNDEVTYIQSKVTLNSITTAFCLANVKDRVPKIKKLKVTKKSNNIEEIKEQLSNLDSLLREKEVEKLIKTENVVHSILNNFQANVGVLHKNASKLNKFSIYNQYFIEPTENYLSNTYTFKEETFHCSTCDNPINTKKEAFNLAWIKGVGVDVNRKTNYYHNFVNTTFICPVCNLILSCAPAGFHFDSNTKKGIFINDNRSVATLIAANKNIDTKTNLSEFEKNSYQSFAEKMLDINSNKKLCINYNIQVIKYDTNLRNLYNFDLINNEFLELVHRNRNRLAVLIDKKVKLDNEYIDLYQASIDSLLRTKNTFAVFETLLGGKYYNGVILSIILNLSIRGENIEKENYLIRKFQNHGAKLATKIKIIDEVKLNKLRTATTKAIKCNDAFAFIELISFYTSHYGIEMLKEIIEVLNSSNSLKLYGYSLLSGLYIERNTDTNKQKHELNNEDDYIL